VVHHLHNDGHTMTDMPRISVIIPTHNRAASLEITLDCLAKADRRGLDVDIIVVDNASSDATRNVVTSYETRLHVRYLYEPTKGIYGKSHALNKALDAGGLGVIIAVLDDDMSVHEDWFHGVATICKRWPDKDIFAGHTYIIWPINDVPNWAKKTRFHSSLFSAVSIGRQDTLLDEGRWFSGNHFWFRSPVLEKKPHFKDIWLTEPDFQLDLAEMGFSGIATPDAVAGHRLQPELLDRKVLLNRAKKTGVLSAQVRLEPYRKKVKQARLLHAYPLLGRLFCLLNHLRWRILYLTAYLYPTDSSRFEHRLIALERMASYIELLRAANRLEDYALRSRVRTESVNKRGDIIMTNKIDHAPFLHSYAQRMKEKEALVALNIVESKAYPKQVPFDPPFMYPEYKGKSINPENKVYSHVRETLYRLGLDRENYNTSQWNPLKSIIQPDMTVLIKPNFVCHEHTGGGDILSVIVHASILRPILDYIRIALRDRGKIIIADSPVIHSSFDGVLTASQTEGLLQTYRRESPVPIECFDLRVYRSTRSWLYGKWSRAPVERDLCL
jgi:glycosyltransferase involved in cell wall biosynthesis